jgi:hypothetical protein
MSPGDAGNRSCPVLIETLYRTNTNDSSPLLTVIKKTESGVCLVYSWISTSSFTTTLLPTLLVLLLFYFYFVYYSYSYCTVNITERKKIRKRRMSLIVNLQLNCFYTTEILYSPLSVIENGSTTPQYFLLHVSDAYPAILNQNPSGVCDAPS